MKTVEHMREIYKSFKEGGLAAALKYDALATAIRHPLISSQLIDYLYLQDEHNTISLAEGILLRSVINNLEVQRRYR